MISWSLMVHHHWCHCISITALLLRSPPLKPAEDYKRLYMTLACQTNAMHSSHLHWHFDWGSLDWFSTPAVRRQTYTTVTLQPFWRLDVLFLLQIKKHQKHRQSHHSTSPAAWPEVFQLQGHRTRWHPAQVLLWPWEVIGIHQMHILLYATVIRMFFLWMSMVLFGGFQLRFLKSL